MFQLVWLSGAAATALGIVLDMHRLRASRVGLGPMGWVVASACIGPIAGAAYLIRRRSARSALIGAVWQLVGDASHSVDVRRKRLIALADSGLLGAPIFQACLAALNAEYRNPASTHEHDAGLPRATDEDAGRST